MKHQPARPIADDEHRLFEHLSEFQSPDTELIRFAVEGRHLGIHEERTRQIVRTWSNEGLVRAAGTPANTGYLTEYGAAVDGLESSHVSGDSWR